MINPKLLKTSTFRMAAIYLAVFAISVASILGYVYWSTVRLIERQTDDTIRAEVHGLADQYRVLGLKGVADVIRRRSANETDTLMVLVGPDGRPVAGNLKGFPLKDAEDKEGWVDFPITTFRNGVAVNHTARGYHTDLPGQFEVLVGRDIEELRQFGDLIRTTLYWALGLSLALGLGGGLLTSRNFLHRIDAITGASRTIMDGNLSRRMPVAGTGDELDRLSVSLNQMLDQIERLMLGMKEVSSNIAHDMKTPLTRMRARVEAALRTDDKNQYRAALNQSIEESDSLLRTFNSLMSIARAESGNAREGFRPIDLGNVLNDVYELYEPLVEDAGGKLVLQLSGSLPVKADRQLLAQAISNLLDNAMKYGHTSELAITLAAQAKPETVEITVSDRGSGIPEEDRERVKDRFVRLDTSRTLPGNGLGLALVASIMRVHGGDLKLTDSAPGLKATLVLPKQATAI